MFEETPSRRSRSFYENQAIRYWPVKSSLPLLFCSDPGQDVCFLTVSDYRFVRGLEALLLGLLDIYPDLTSPFIILHDGSLGGFLRRRLLSVYPRIDFQVPDAGWAHSLPADSSNRSRIGKLGYLNTHALSITGFRRVIVLDADLLIEGSLDYLWAEGNAFRLAADCGVRPWTPLSEITRKPVLNSGVISIPGSEATPANLKRIESLILNASIPYCPLLDSYADQKIWNQYLADECVEIAPLNYNCNAKYLFRHLHGISYGLSVIHFAGAKPWMMPPWMESQIESCKTDETFDLACLYWNDRYVRLLAPWRIKMFNSILPFGSITSVSGRALVGDSLDGLIARSSSVDTVHLVLSSPGFIHGIMGDNPSLSAQFLERLRMLPWLHIWLPFELEPLLRSVDTPPNITFHWLLLETLFHPVPVEFASLTPQGYDELRPERSRSVLETMRAMVQQSLVEAGSQVELLHVP